MISVQQCSENISVCGFVSRSFDSIIIIDAVTTIDAVVVFVVIGLLMVWRNDISVSFVLLEKKLLFFFSFAMPTNRFSSGSSAIGHLTSGVIPQVSSLGCSQMARIPFWWSIEKQIIGNYSGFVSHRFGTLTKSQNHIVDKWQSIHALDTLGTMSTILFFLFRTFDRFICHANGANVTRSNSSS